jgi:hypothetical protein
VQEINAHMSSNTDTFCIPFHLASESATFWLDLENDIHENSEAIRSRSMREQISTSAMQTNNSMLDQQEMDLYGAMCGGVLDY